MTTRRDFLKFSALTGFSTLGLSTSLFAEKSITFSDYKALVVILQHGGNDSINMFIPNGANDKTGYDNYAAIRTSLKVDNNDLSAKLTQTAGKLVLSSGNANPYYNDTLEKAYTKGLYPHAHIKGLATNGVMPEFAHLVNQKKVAMIANVGNLVQPTTRAEILAKTATLPLALYSHNSQRKLVFNGLASELNRRGWAGQIADQWNNVNNNSIYGINISLKGVSHLLYGAKTEPLIFNPKGPSEYKYIKRSLYDNWLAANRPEKFQALYQRLRKRSFLTQDVVVEDWNKNSPSFTSTNAYGGELFSSPDSATFGIANNDSVKDLSDQLKAVAKLAYIGKNKGLKRQIFYVVHGGYDTHSNQAQQHASLLRGLSLSLGDFQRALSDMGMEDKVTTFNLSDFGRSIGNNGDGTDHAWGGHYFAIGAAVKGGLYGRLPDLTLGGADDAKSKGRLIPTLSMSQYLATLVKWFGADDAMLNQLFPELKNFTSTDLGFMG
ncbi:MAG: DUF1501 domain-containing protein [Cocleimonas sp.]|nr:DUF1501 domain-containing protein [Cocleimonas sp.]